MHLSKAQAVRVGLSPFTGRDLDDQDDVDSAAHLFHGILALITLLGVAAVIGLALWIVMPLIQAAARLP